MVSQQQIGKELKKARKKLNLKQIDIAEKVGINPNYYARLERGEETPSLDTLKKLAQVLKIKSLDIL